MRHRALAAVSLLFACLIPPGRPAAHEGMVGGAPRIRAHRVLDVPLAATQVTMVDGTLWVGSRGGGVMAFTRGRLERRFDLGHGLPSAIVHDLGGLSGGRVVVGTDRGAVVIDPGSGDIRAIDPHLEHRGPAAVDLVVSSARSPAALVQLAPLDGERPTSLWRWESGRVQRWDPRLGSSLVATAGFYDPTDGCLHIAGVQAVRAARVPWYGKDCAGTVSAWTLAEGAPDGTIGVAGLARAPRSDRIVLMVVTQPTPSSTSRRSVAMEILEDASLTTHCSQATYAEPVTDFVRHGNALIVARLGGGLEVLGCGWPRSLSGDPRLREPTALASDARAGLLVATDVAVIAVKDDGSTSVVAQSPEPRLPADALPMQPSASGSRVLLSSPALGPLELERRPSAWHLARRWRAAGDTARAVHGHAIYAINGDVLSISHSTGIARLRGELVIPMRLEGGGAVASMLRDLVETPHGLWISAAGTPFHPAAAGLHFIASSGGPRFVPLPDPRTQPGSRMLAWPDGRVWVGTRFGVIEADPHGETRRVSAERVDALYRNDALDVVGAVGATIQHWDGQRLAPILFAVEPRRSRAPGHPVDLIIDDSGRWIILYSDGVLVLLDAQRRFAATLDAASGVPPSSRRLLYLPATDEILIGSAREGVFSLSWPQARRATRP